TVHGGRRTALVELAEVVAEVENGQVVASHPVTLGDWLERWLAKEGVDKRNRLDGGPTRVVVAEEGGGTDEQAPRVAGCYRPWVGRAH
ncbi:MAG: hypothetical protein ABSA91_10780, partial [Acidimicrobiales bacterium]